MISANLYLHVLIGANLYLHVLINALYIHMLIGANLYLHVLNSANLQYNYTCSLHLIGITVRPYQALSLRRCLSQGNPTNASLSVLQQLQRTVYALTSSYEKASRIVHDVDLERPLNEYYIHALPRYQI